MLLTMREKTRIEAVQAVMGGRLGCDVMKQTPPEEALFKALGESEWVRHMFCLLCTQA